jgi:transcriptional regulator with XRE-family HTH domain
MKSEAITSIPPSIRDGLKKLGQDITRARKRKGISTSAMAEQARISRPTLYRLERGDANVSLGILATALNILGMKHRLTRLLDEEPEEMKESIPLDVLSDRVPQSQTTRHLETDHFEIGVSD